MKESKKKKPITENMVSFLKKLYDRIGEPIPDFTGWTRQQAVDEMNRAWIKLMERHKPVYSNLAEKPISKIGQ